MGQCFIFSATGYSTWLPWLFKYHGKWFGNCISQFTQDSGMHLARSHRPVFSDSSGVYCFPTVEGTLLPSGPALRSTNLRGWEERLAVKTEAKRLLSFQPFFPHLLWPVYQPCSPQGVCFSFLAEIPIEVVIFLCIPLLISVPTLPWPSWPHHYTTGQTPNILPRIPVLTFTVSAFPCCPLIWQACIHSTILFSCLPFLISYTFNLKTKINFEISS